MRLRSVALVLALIVVSCGDSSSPTIAVDSSSTSSASTQFPATTTTAAATENACPTATFEIEAVNAYEQLAVEENPQLEIECTETAFVVISNNVPNFDYVQVTPNALESNPFEIEFPLEPTEADEPGGLALGGIGVSVTGITIFGAFEAPRDGWRDPFLDGLLDACSGHTAPGGWYHFHTLMSCIVDDHAAPGIVLGYAYDGYEIVTPWQCVDAACSETEEVFSSYERTGQGIGAFDDWTYVDFFGDLDECNGRTDDDGSYRYYATNDFPYLPFCYHGETDYADGIHDDIAPTGVGG